MGLRPHLKKGGWVRWMLCTAAAAAVLLVWVCHGGGVAVCAYMHTPAYVWCGEAQGSTDGG